MVEGRWIYQSAYREANSERGNQLSRSSTLEARLSGRVFLKLQVRLRGGFYLNNKPKLLYN